MTGAQTEDQKVPEVYVEKLEQGLWDLSRRADLAEAEAHYLRRLIKNALAAAQNGNWKAAEAEPPSRLRGGTPIALRSTS